jgi:hypothetical protein
MALNFNEISNADIRAMRKGGDSTWEILVAVVNAGMEFPDASSKIKFALGLDEEETSEMERGYDECA